MIQDRGSNNNIPAGTDLSLLGVSVGWLRTGFLQQVQAAGFSPQDSTFYDIEDLQQSKPGVIRSLSAATICPMTHQPGAAYVHSCPQHAVGPATHMLSWSWGYTVQTVVDTLLEFCHSQELDPNQIYFWICAFCVNQHRVAESQAKSGAVVPSSLMATKAGNSNDTTTTDCNNLDKTPYKKVRSPSLLNFFQTEFRDRVVKIGRVVCMLSPWHAPLYLTRAWCIFEAYTAMSSSNTCQVSIVMPPEEKKKLAQELIGATDRGGFLGIDSLYDTLSKTKVQEAKASVEEDRVMILNAIEQGVGYHKTNMFLNECFRKWVRGVISDLVADKEQEMSVDNDDGGDFDNNPMVNQKWLSYAEFCNTVGVLFRRNGEHQAALEMHKKALAIHLDHNIKSGINDNQLDMAQVYNDMGVLHCSMGNYELSLETHQHALKIRREHHHDNDSLATAQSWNNIGNVYSSIGKYDEALENYNKTAAIRERILGQDHSATATAYNNIAGMYVAKAEYDRAIDEFHKVLAVQEKSLGKEHPGTSTTLNNLALAHHYNGQHLAAKEGFQKVLAIQETTLGNNHPQTAITYNNAGLACHAMGDYDEALQYFHQAIDIDKKLLGEDHPAVATAHNNMALVFFAKRAYTKALQHHEHALRVREASLGTDHVSSQASQKSIVLVKSLLQRDDEQHDEDPVALSAHRSSLSNCLEEVLKKK